MGVLPHFDTELLAQTPQPSVNKQITLPLDVTDAIYNANTTKHLGSKNISLTPYRMTEDHAFDQGFLRGVGNVTNNQTYIGTHLSDESKVEVVGHLRLQMDKVLLGYLFL